MNTIKDLQTGIYVKDLDSGQSAGQLSNQVFEGSSVIKAAIVLLALRKAQNEQLSLKTRLEIHPRHQSIGSGVLHWTKIHSLSIKDHLYYIGRFSDCVASNVLIEFIGGREEVNKQLSELGFQTKLQMDLLIFTDNEATMPRVSTTTPQEIAEIFVMMYQSIRSSKYRRTLAKSFTFVNHTWVRDTLNLNNLGNYRIVVKTGSMMEVGPRQDSVMNLVGIVELPKTTLSFSCLNRFSFQVPPSPTDIYQVKTKVMKELTDKISLMSDPDV